MLGIWIGTDEKRICDQNYNEINEKAKAVMLKWKAKTISLIGKILIINSLVMLLFVYRMMVLPKMSEAKIKDLNCQIEKFIWNGARPKISRAVLCRMKKEGGLKLVDYNMKDDSIKVTWSKILQSEPKLKALVYKNNRNILEDLIWSCNLNPKDVGEIICDNFWKQNIYSLVQTKAITQRGCI